MRQPLKSDDWDFHDVDIIDSEHEELVRSVGRVAILSARLESSLRFLFYRLMSSDEALVISEGETPDWLLKNCERLINEEHVHENHRKGRRASTLPLLKECREAFQERGTIIHSSWAIEDDGRYIALSSKRGRSMLAYRYSINEINELADKFDALDQRVGSVEGYGT